MSAEVILAIIGGVIVLATFVVLLMRKLPKRIRSTHYVRKWREIQKLCKNKEDWSHAIIHADMLLDEVLIKKRVTGNTMGERMVSAHDSFTTNDKLWSAHKLANNLRLDGERKITEPVIKEALVTFRQALRDVGAL